MPLPSAAATVAVPLHVACSSDGGGGSGSGGGPASAHLLATCCHASAVVHLWDARLLPLELPIAANAAFASEGLSAAARRCLVATLPLPAGAACARQLSLDGARLLAAVDHDAAATPFARGAHSACLFDVRASGGAVGGGASWDGAAAAGGGAADAGSAAAAPTGDGEASNDGGSGGGGSGGGSGGGCLLWEQPVPGEMTCFHSKDDQIYVGTSSGAVLLWRFGGASRGVAGGAEDLGRPEKGPKREKWRAKGAKVRSRYPKSQGFSNMKSGFH